MSITQVSHSADGVTVEIAFAPPTPARLGALARPDGTEVVWSPARAYGGTAISSYRVYRDGTLAGEPARATFSDPGVAPGETHAYSVEAVDSAGAVSAIAGPIEVTTPDGDDVTPPARPVSPRVVGRTPRSVTIAWGGSADDVGTVAYVVLRDGEPIAVTGSLDIIDTELTPGTLYRYEVLGADADGNVSAPSDAVYVVTASACARVAIVAACL